MTAQTATGPGQVSSAPSAVEIDGFRAGLAGLARRTHAGFETARGAIGQPARLGIIIKFAEGGEAIDGAVVFGPGGVERFAHIGHQHMRRGFRVVGEIKRRRRCPDRGAVCLRSVCVPRIGNREDHEIERDGRVRCEVDRQDVAALDRELLYELLRQRLGLVVLGRLTDAACACLLYTSPSPRDS